MIPSCWLGLQYLMQTARTIRRSGQQRAKRRQQFTYLTGGSGLIWQAAQLKAEQCYVDACKIVKGLEPKFGHFVTKASVNRALESSSRASTSGCGGVCGSEGCPGGDKGEGACPKPADCGLLFDGPIPFLHSGSFRALAVASLQTGEPLQNAFKTPSKPSQKGMPQKKDTPRSRDWKNGAHASGIKHSKAFASTVKASQATHWPKDWFCFVGCRTRRLPHLVVESISTPPSEGQEGDQEGD